LCLRRKEKADRITGSIAPVINPLTRVFVLD
jgi:hypothetical protein